MVKMIGKSVGVSLPNTYIPFSNNDLVAKYESFVAKLVSRHNRVTSNYQDILQHVWMRLFEVGILDKYELSGNSLPNRVPITQALAYLQMTLNQFKMAQWRYRVGDNRGADALRVPVPVSSSVFDRDRGICHKCEVSALLSEERLAAQKAKNPAKWKATRLAMLEKFDIPVGRKTFWVAERIPGAKSEIVIENYRTTCLCCVYKARQGVAVRTKSEWAPTPIEGTPCSKTAVYAKGDIERFKKLRGGSKRVAKHASAIEVGGGTKCPFKYYLARAVVNIYKNWCRTQSRRCKEIYPGPNEDGQTLEDFLEDTRCSSEDMVDLYRTVKLISSGEDSISDVDFSSNEDTETETEICRLVENGYSMAEVIQKLSLARGTLQMLAEG